MVERQKDPCRVTLKDVRLSYPQLFKAKAFGKGDGDPAFSASFLIDKETKVGRANIEAIEDAIYEAKLAKWGSKDKFPKLKDDKLCFHDGDEDEDEAEEKIGMMVLSSRNKKRPKVLDRDKTELDESDGVVYGGCYVDAVVRLWAQDNEWGKRINCSLEAVRFRRDGEPFGAAPFDPDEFEDLEDEDDEPRRNRGGGRRDRDEDDDRGSRRRRDRDEDDDRGSRRSRRSRDEDDDDRSSRRSSRRSRDDDEDDDDRGPRRRSRDEDDDDMEDRPSRNSRSRRSRDEDDDGRGSRRRRSRDDDDIV